jgi:hypothetical protein
MGAIDAPCTQCLRHGDPMHAQERLTDSFSAAASASLCRQLSSWGRSSQTGAGGSPLPISACLPDAAPAASASIILRHPHTHTQHTRTPAHKREFN